LESLTLTNFKNYRSEKIELSAKLNCLTGLNGMGKTNILDAVYYLCMCKSHFSTTDVHIALQGEDFFRLEGIFNLDGSKKSKIVAKVQARKAKIFENQDLSYEKLSDHIGKFPVVMIAPDDTELLTEGSEERRRLMDITLSQLDQHYLHSLQIYNKVLEQRNALLKQFFQSQRFDAGLLEVYDSQLIAPANYIFQQRKVLLEQLLPIFQLYYKIISGDREQPSFSYESKLLDYDLETLLLENREKDRILQRTSSGIHRDDVLFIFSEGIPAKRFASQGQLKSFLLAIKLAQYEVLHLLKGQRPILLLDDIFDKLDMERVKHLLSLLSDDQFGQLFITDTQEERILSIIGDLQVDFKHFKVNQGHVQ
ncbi:MAG: DNA replication/repair protein RecF, partial [Saprospiraceae bacterium]